MSLLQPKEGDLVGRTIGGFTVRELIGRGGMASVFRAHDPALDRDVALKVLSTELVDDPEYAERFVREARMAAVLDHPNVVPVFASGEDQGFLYMAMLRVEGRTLESVMQARAPMPAREALDIVRQVAEGLGAAHERGMIHRDIKPTNVMIDATGRVRLMDFGLARSTRHHARLTASNIYLGTPEYSSPEQCETDALDGRSDLYSLGVVLYEMLTGRTPHVGETPLALFKKITSEEPPPIRSINENVTEDVALFVHRMLRKDPNERFQSASELLIELNRVIQRGRVTGMRPNRAAEPAGRRAVVAAALLGLIVVGVLLGVLLPRGDPTPPAAPPPAAPTAVPLKLVVADFTMLRGADDDRWMELGLADLLSKTLRQHPFLGVPLREEVAAKLDGAPAFERRDEIARAFDPDLVLHGDVYAIGREIQVTVKAYRPTGSTPAFELTFRRDKEQIFDLVDEMVRGIVETLRAGGEAYARGPTLAMAVPAAFNVTPCQTIASQTMPAADAEVVAPTELAMNVETMLSVPAEYREFLGTKTPPEGAPIGDYEMSRLWFGTQDKLQKRLKHGDTQEAFRRLRIAADRGGKQDVVTVLSWVNENGAPYADAMLDELVGHDLLQFICPECPDFVGTADQICPHCESPLKPEFRMRQVMEKIKKVELENGPPVEEKE